MRNLSVISFRWIITVPRSIDIQKQWRALSITYLTFHPIYLWRKKLKSLLKIKLFSSTQFWWIYLISNVIWKECYSNWLKFERIIAIGVVRVERDHSMSTAARFPLLWVAVNVPWTIIHHRELMNERFLDNTACLSLLNIFSSNGSKCIWNSSKIEDHFRSNTIHLISLKWRIRYWIFSECFMSIDEQKLCTIIKQIKDTLLEAVYKKKTIQEISPYRMKPSDKQKRFQC